MEHSGFMADLIPRTLEEACEQQYQATQGREEVSKPVIATGMAVEDIEEGDLVYMEVDGGIRKRDHKELHDLDDLSSFPKQSTLSRQVGGDHYKRLKIQPVEYIMANGINYVLGNVIKYVSRDKEGVSKLEDLEKAKHYLEIEIERLKG